MNNIMKAMFLAVNPASVFHCVKCNKTPDGVEGHNDAATNSSYAIVYCHGAKQHVELDPLEVYLYPYDVFETKGGEDGKA
jgi:hypothetical protein